MDHTLRVIAGIAVFASGFAVFFEPRRAPWLVGASLALALVSLGRAKRAARGMALGGAVVWATIAVGLGIVSQVVAATEPLASGRPIAGHWAYLATLALLAALISVLNARTPGGKAWAILMALLVVVFLIPWLEGPGLRRAFAGSGQLRLESPWTIFYGLLVLAGVTNFLPTRYAGAAVLLAVGFVAEYVGLTREVAPPRLAALWSVLPWSIAAAVWVARGKARAPAHARGRLEEVWLWFRDHWGVVWALRVMERFNRAAEAQRWPLRLTWHGVVMISGDGPLTPADDEAAARLLIGLLRRFAEPSRLEEAAGIAIGRPCESSNLG